MSNPELQRQLEDLRAQLTMSPPLTDKDRATLQLLIEDIEAQLALETPAAPDPSLVDGVTLAVEHFEVSHPTMAGALRNIMQSLVSMGI
jgi:hypothetical protein